jgi:hypothetical protein
MNDTAILDSGCTHIFWSATAPCMDKRAAHVPLHVNMPNGMSIQSSHTSELLLSALPPSGQTGACISRTIAQLLELCRTTMRQRIQRHLYERQC